MNKVFNVRYDTGEHIVDYDYTENDVTDIEYHPEYITIKYTNGIVDMLPWSTIIRVREMPKDMATEG